MGEFTIFIEAPVNPTESEEKVTKAVQNVFGNIEPKTTQITNKISMLKAETGELRAMYCFRDLLRREHIRDAARKILYEGLDDNEAVNFCLNKQVAYAGHVSFCQEHAESPLGPIKVKIKTENASRIIAWLVSKTDEILEKR